MALDPEQTRKALGAGRLVPVDTKPDGPFGVLQLQRELAERLQQTGDEQMRALIHWHAANGIDTEILHAFYYSIEGERRSESPPDLFYHQIWKDQFHRFVEDASRMLYLAGRGDQVTDIGIFYPTTAIMTEGGMMNFVPLAKMEGNDPDLRVRQAAKEARKVLQMPK